MEFIETQHSLNKYHFICEGCGADGELEIEAGAEAIGCPEGCGAMYVQWHNPITNKPDLTCVVCPVFIDE